MEAKRGRRNKLTIKKQLSNIKEVDDSPGLFDPTPEPGSQKNNYMGEQR